MKDKTSYATFVTLETTRHLKHEEQGTVFNERAKDFLNQTRKLNENRIET